MSRGWFVYILMSVIAAAGLWVILILGRAANAPDDLSGKWTVEWETAPPAKAVLPGETPRMDVAQSGRFFVVQFGERDPLSLTLEPGWSGKREGRRLKMKLTGSPWKLEVRGDIPAGERFRVPEVRVELVGPTSRHVGVARREREQTVEVAPAKPLAPATPAPTTQPMTTPTAAVSTSSARTTAAETVHAR